MRNATRALAMALTTPLVAVSSLVNATAAEAAAHCGNLDIGYTYKSGSRIWGAGSWTRRPECEQYKMTNIHTVELQLWEVSWGWYYQQRVGVGPFVVKSGPGRAAISYNCSGHGTDEYYVKIISRPKASNVSDGWQKRSNTIRVSC